MSLHKIRSAAGGGEGNISQLSNSQTSTQHQYWRESIANVCQDLDKVTLASQHVTWRWWNLGDDESFLSTYKHTHTPHYSKQSKGDLAASDRACDWYLNQHSMNTLPPTESWQQVFFCYSYSLAVIFDSNIGI